MDSLTQEGARRRGPVAAERETRSWWECALHLGGPWVPVSGLLSSHEYLLHPRECAI